MAKKLTSEQKAFAFRLVIILLVAAISVAGYVGFAYLQNKTVGFPLDDSWIHQTYAKNFADGEGWVYQQGQVSGGSTSPLFTALLSVIHFLNLPPVWGAYLLGFVLFVIAGMMVEEWLRNTINFNYAPKLPVAALVFLTEWHFVWASLSGMETMLFIVFILGVFLLLSKSSPRWLWIGLWVGLSIWVRPDGITLLGPVFFSLALSSIGKREKLATAMRVAAGFLIAFLPYLSFNRIIAGQWMPNTFYAKQIEYGVMQEIPFFTRMFNLYVLPFVGVGALLLPGLVDTFANILKKRNWLIISSVLWSTGYILIYVWRLPVTYQHGRYVMPAMPIFIMLGFAGAMAVINKLRTGKFWERIAGTVWLLSALLILGIFWFQGMTAYQEDVAIIQEEMVNPSMWISENTGSDALIAAHDIGALGYFGQREIIDLAGLISPEVIPMIRNEKELASYLQARNVDYLMTFPDWYADLPLLGTMVYESGGQTAKQMGYPNMMIYQLNFDE